MNVRFGRVVTVVTTPDGEFVIPTNFAEEDALENFNLGETCWCGCTDFLDDCTDYEDAVENCERCLLCSNYPDDTRVRRLKEQVFADFMAAKGYPVRRKNCRRNTGANFSQPYIAVGL